MSLTFTLVLVAVGCLAGITAGLLGVGGGIIIVPVLYHLLTQMGIDEAIRMHISVGTSLAVIIPTSISSIRAHWKRGSIDPAVLRSWGPWVFVGVVVGTAVASLVAGVVLTAFFAIFAVLMAANLAFSPETRTIANQLPVGRLRAIYAMIIGAFSSMLGIGGGSFSVPILTAYGYPIRRAVGTSAAIGLVIAVPGAVGFALSGQGVSVPLEYSLGFVYLPGLLALAPTALLFAPLGARIAHSINAVWLRRVFAVFLFATAMRMIAGLLG